MSYQANGVNTDDRRVEEEFRHLNRALKARTECSRVLVRATHELTFLEQICRILVDQGGYRLAWVGYPEHDEAKTVRLVAQAGAGTERLETLNVTWADNERGRGPAGTCIRTRQVVVARDIATDPTMAPWREETARHRFASVATLPLLHDGELLGTLVVYASKPDSFDQAELGLLTGLAEDLAFGIATLRTREARLRAEETLREERRRLADIIEADSAGTWEWNVQTGELIINRRWAEIVGYTLEELSPTSIGTWERIAHPDDLAASGDLLTKHFRGELDYYDIEVRVRHKSGDWVWVRDRGKVVSWTGDGLPQWMRGTHHDITERRAMVEDIRQWNAELERKVADRTAELADANRQITQAMSQVAQSEARYRAVFEQSLLGKALAESLSGRLIEVNERLLEITGCSREELTSDGWNRITHPDDLAAELVQVKRLDAGEITDFQMEKRFLRPDGSVVWCHLTIEKLSPGTGAGHLYLIVVEDISSRKGSEQALLVAKEQAETANRVKGEFLANMSHEIRTPMNGVIGMAGLLLDTPLNAEQRRYAETIHASGKSLLALVNDVLDVSRIEAGKLEMEVTDVDVRLQLNELAESLDSRIKEKGLKFLCGAASDVPALLRGDSGRLRQILVNLAENALKFTERGQISVQADRLNQSESGVLIRFAVLDTGIGISAAQQQRLFQKFTQVDASTTRRFGGSGLGLAICKQLVELMGGEIGVNSQPGAGSEFWFTVPLGLPERPVSGAAATSGPVKFAPVDIPALKRSGARILVAEDNVVNQEVALNILRKLGARADGVADGAEAVEALKTLPYDLVLMDLHMPEMDGFEATRIIRDPESPVSHHGVPIIALTASALRGDRELCLAAGMNDYITKPITPHSLVAALNAWLPSEAGKARSNLSPHRVAAGTAEPDLPVFDRKGLIARLMGDEDVVVKVVTRFLESMPSQMQSLRELLNAGNAANVERAAHGIKGAAANIGGERLRRAAFKIEEAANAGDLSSAKGHFTDMEFQFEQLKGAMLAGEPASVHV
jgi:PAS domain S-box-containing protein